MQRLAQGDPEGAVEPFERAVSEQPERAVEALQGLVQAHSVLGRTEQAGAALARLEAQWREHPDRRHAEALTASLAVVGERRRAEQLAREGLERFPTSSSLWWLSAEGHYRDGQLVEAEQAYDRALEFAAPDDPGWRAVLLRCGARACSERDPHKAIRLLVSALLLDRDFARTRLVVETEREHFPPERVDEVLAQLSLGTQELAAVELLFAGRNPQDASEQCDILAGHLRRMIDLCRARGARPVLLTYPTLEAEIEEVQVSVARAASVPLIRIRERFDEELLRRSRDELFVPDGHCSDAGYALMGELAAEAALELIGR